MAVVSRPEVYVANVWEKVKDGQLADPVARDLIKQAAALVDAVRAQVQQAA